MRENAKIVSKYLKYLSNDNRLLILCVLLEQPLTVGELNKIINDISLPALSQHLQKLKDGGFICSRKDRQSVIYMIKDEKVKKLIALLKEEFCK